VLTTHASTLRDALSACLGESGGIRKSNGAALALGLCLLSLLSLEISRSQNNLLRGVKNYFLLISLSPVCKSHVKGSAVQILEGFGVTSTVVEN